MQLENRNCQNCRTQFTIEPEDFQFYEKIQVPPPTWCPECRNMRRMAWREERVLYRDACKLCGKPIITIHAPAGPFTVYCRECYRSDKWDPMDFGREYDFNTPFFVQYRELMESVPRPALTGTNLTNSDFTHACQSVKNCYYVFWSYFSENSQNSWALLMSRNAYGCYVVDNSDYVYESLHSNRLYKVNFGYFSDDCLDSSFLYDCIGCSDCFGCVNLRKQKHCLFNRKYSKDDYLNKRREWDMGSYGKLQEAKGKFRELYLSMPHRFAHVRSSQNVTGDIIRDTKDCKICFSALDGVENCKFLYFGGLNLKDSYDVSAGGDTSELLYEALMTTGNVQRCLFSAGCGNSRDISYCNWVSNCSDVFGCISLQNRRYCVLNKQYAPERYKELVEDIREHMDKIPYVDKQGRVYKFGEFFPTELSAYAYNETVSFTWYPKTKEEVLSRGWRWQDPPERSYKITVKAGDLPDHIKDVKDDIVGKVIQCAHTQLNTQNSLLPTCNEQCITAFRISREELEFHRQMKVALPRLCPNCRNSEILKWRNGYKLWSRRCQCFGNAQTDADLTLTSAENVQRSSVSSPLQSAKYVNTCRHFHGESKCPNNFETTFSPERPETLYCDQCFKAEFL